jgi:hypothetical protein
MIRKALKGLAYLFAALVVAIVLLLAPVGYVETFCRGKIGAARTDPKMSDPAFWRAEANTYLTYPEWHIVYAYDGLAETLKTSDEYAFDYLGSIAGFWSSTCQMMRYADAHGGADGATRLMVHTIGVSFTLEMLMKAAYEETVGRLFAAIRGDEKTPQDLVARDMAATYAAFLRQTPWYKFDFGQWRDKLDAAPITYALRGWERRLALGGEWSAEIAYARAIAAGVAATGEAKLTIRSLVSDMPTADLAAVAGVMLIEETTAGAIIETERYDAFTKIIANVTAKGGRFVEIAGNDDIMASIRLAPGEAYAGPGSEIARVSRDGFIGDRVLATLKTGELGALYSAYPATPARGVEHVFDY